MPTVELADLRPLALLAVVPLLWAIARGSRVPARPQARRLMLASRTLFVAALALALARPVVTVFRGSVATTVLVDVSDSMSRDASAASARLIDDLRAAMRRDDTLSVLAFAGRVRAVALPERGPLDPAALAPLPEDQPSETRLADAIEVALGSLPSDSTGRLLIVSDGNATSGDTLAAAMRAADRRVEVHYVIPPEATAPDVAVRQVTAPDRARVRAPFVVTAELYATGATRAVATLSRDDVPVPVGGRKELDLHAGRNTVTWTTEGREPGLLRLAVQLSELSADSVTANDRAEAAIFIEGRPRILYVEGEPRSAGHLERALGSERFEVELRGPSTIPSDPMVLDRYELVILSDIDPVFVGTAQIAALDRYVRERGGGLIVAGGEHGLATLGDGDTALDRLLPVRPEGQRKREDARVGLVLAIDRSGSMQGLKIELAKEAARAAIRLLDPDDLVGVVAFDSQAVPLVRLQRAAARVKIDGDIARLQAGGGTSILPALEQAYTQLAPAQARVRHVILMTDGQSSYDGISALVDRMVAHGITVSGVGVGDGADKTLLTMIAERGGGRFYYTEDAQNIPRIFTQETSEVTRSSATSESVGVRVARRAELLAGVPLATAPALAGYVSTRPRPLAEVLLTTHAGAPLLARWRTGLGQVAVFTSDVKDRWAARWLTWPGYARFWSQLSRSIARHDEAPSRATFETHVEVEPPVARILVDALDPKDEPVSGLEIRAELSDPAHPAARTSYELDEIGAGRYELRTPLDRYGSWLVRLSYRLDGEALGQTTTSFSLPYSREYLALPADRAGLERLSATTGGRASPDAASLWRRPETRRRERRPVWPWLVWAAVCILVVDTAVRRVASALPAKG